MYIDIIKAELMKEVRTRSPWAVRAVYRHFRELISFSRDGMVRKKNENGNRSMT